MSEPSATGAAPVTVDLRYIGGLAALFLVSQLAAHHVGVRFDVRLLSNGWHILDPELLRNDLVRSLLDLHSQPPFFNLFLGLVLKATPGREAAVFGFFFGLLGLTLCLATFVLMRRLGVRPRIAGGLAAIFTVSPAVLLYGAWLFPAMPLAVLTMLAVLAFDRLLRAPSARTAALLGSLLTVLGLTHALFHLALCVGAVVAAAVASRLGLRAVAIGLLPLALLLAVYAKNHARFGVFGASSWMGMNAARITAPFLTPGQQATLREESLLSTSFGTPPFSPLSSYPPAWQGPACTGASPALCAPVKSTGAPNLNHVAYLAISKAAWRDTVTIVRAAPDAYLRGLQEAWGYYFWSPTDYSFLAPNRRAIHRWNAIFDALAFGRIPLPAGFELSRPCLWLLFGLPLVFVGGLATAISGGADGFSREARSLAAACCLLIAWVALANFIEVGENNRMRFMTDALSVSLLGMLIERSCQRRARRDRLRP